jgi:hypothetical protein
LSGSELKDARKYMDDATFKRDRLRAALGKLRERLAELKDQKENARRQVGLWQGHGCARAKELADVYPAFAQKLAELLSRIAANDRAVDYINNHALPKGADRLLVAELKARGLSDWMVNSVDAAHHRSPATAPMAAALRVVYGHRENSGAETHTWVRWPLVRWQIMIHSRHKAWRSNEWLTARVTPCWCVIVPTPPVLFVQISSRPPELAHHPSRIRADHRSQG